MIENMPEDHKSTDFENVSENVQDNDDELEEAMEQVYAKNTVPHISTGKAVSRALRAHFLVESGLTSKLMTPLIIESREVIGEECGEAEGEEVEEEDKNESNWASVKIDDFNT